MFFLKFNSLLVDTDDEMVDFIVANAGFGS